jgi:hypothetical protein
MPTERVQRQIDLLLEEAEQALRLGDWETVRLRCGAVLRLDHANGDAVAYLAAGTQPGTAAALDGAPAAAPTPSLGHSIAARCSTRCATSGSCCMPHGMTASTRRKKPASARRYRRVLSDDGLTMASTYVHPDCPNHPYVS